jgi:hypothetical protein
VIDRDHRVWTTGQSAAWHRQVQKKLGPVWTRRAARGPRTQPPMAGTRATFEAAAELRVHVLHLGDPVLGGDADEAERLPERDLSPRATEPLVAGRR